MKTQATFMNLVFSYGSNMSLKRLQARCTTAQFVTTGYVEGYTLQFNKNSKDGSGKADLTPMKHAHHNLWGVVSEIADTDLT